MKNSCDYSGCNISGICIVNPKTGKPYARHRYDNIPRVTSYTGSFSTGMKPATYALSRKCVRCGYRAKDMRY